MFDFIKANLRLFIGLIVAVAGLLFVQLHVTSGSNEFLGVADSKELTVSFDTPVTVKRVLVLPGERVRKGQPLVEVTPTEINLRILELQSELRVLESEKNVRSALLNGLGSKATIDFKSPISQEIEGIKEQLVELKRQQANGVRFAEDDGIVATVAYRAREQVPPFVPVVTLISNSPDMVFGFLHENRATAYQIGDHVNVVPLADSSRLAPGQVVSMGSRITPFPARFQQFLGDNPQHFGREVMVRIASQNRILAGEKVQILGSAAVRSEGLNFVSIADANDSDPKVDSEKILAGIDLEASGIIYDETSDTMIVISDDAKKGESPFWRISPEIDSAPLNLKMKGLSALNDLESLTKSENGQYYAMSSLLEEGKGSKGKGSLLVRFKMNGDSIEIDRALNIRQSIVNAIESEGLLQRLAGSLKKIEVESLTFAEGHGYIGLKEPQLEDGSSVILKIYDLEAKIEQKEESDLSIGIHSIVRLSDSNCRSTSRVTDLLKTDDGLLILGNCEKKENSGQVWRVSDAFPMETPELLFRLPNARPEGFVVLDDDITFYLTSDNGKKEGSDIYRIKRLKN